MDTRKVAEYATRVPYVAEYVAESGRHTHTRHSTYWQSTQYNSHPAPTVGLLLRGVGQHERRGGGGRDDGYGCDDGRRVAAASHRGGGGDSDHVANPVRRRDGDGRHRGRTAEARALPCAHH